MLTTGDGDGGVGLLTTGDGDGVGLLTTGVGLLTIGLASAGTLIVNLTKGLFVIFKDVTVGLPGRSDLKSKTVGLSPPLRSLYRGPCPFTSNVPWYCCPVFGSVTTPV